jgi:hypothetical protein
MSLCIIVIAVMMASSLLAGENTSSNGGSNFFLTIAIALFSALIGYGLGVLKAFREYKQKVYQEILQPILAMAYNMRRGEQEENNFNQALAKLWLYANKDVAKKTDKAVSIIHQPSRGDITASLQEAIAAMRRDIQIFPWQRLNAKEVNHIYTQLSGKKDK